MTVTATSSISASPVDRYLVRTQTSKNIIGQTTDTLLQYGRQGLNIGGKVGLTFAGFLMILGGAIGKTIAPEKTAWDLISLVAMIGGAIMSFIGFGKLWQADKKNETLPLPEAHEKVSKVLDDTLKPLVKECTDLDPPFLKVGDFSSRIAKGEKDLGLRNLAVNLFSNLSGDELRNCINSYIGGTARKVIHFANRFYSTQDLKDKVALLLGYVVSSRDTNDDAVYKNIVETYLKDDDVEKGQCELLSILPEEFNLVYEVARGYDKNHNQAGQEKPLSYMFTRSVEDLENILSQTAGGSTKDSALNYLRSYADTYNKFKVLAQAISYVLKYEGQDNSNTVTSTTSRNAALIRQALVCALRLKANNNTEILQQLKRIYEGDERNTGSKAGLLSKIKEMDSYRDSLIQMIGRGKVNIRFFDKAGRDPNSNVGKIFPTGINLIEIREVMPEPV